MAALGLALGKVTLDAQALPVARHILTALVQRLDVVKLYSGGGAAFEEAVNAERMEREVRLADGLESVASNSLKQFRPLRGFCFGTRKGAAIARNDQDFCT